MKIIVVINDQSFSSDVLWEKLQSYSDHSPSESFDMTSLVTHIAKQMFSSKAWISWWADNLPTEFKSFEAFCVDQACNTILQGYLVTAMSKMSLEEYIEYRLECSRETEDV